METENKKQHLVKRFCKAVVSALPDILMFIGIYCLVFLMLFSLTKGIENDTKAEVLAAENEYLKGQIGWYQAQLADKHSVPVPVITDGDPDE